MKTIISSIPILTVLTAVMPNAAVSKAINLPCISQGAANGDWLFPTAKEEYFPLVIIKVQVWTKGMEQHPLYSPRVKESFPKTRLGSCAVFTADKESWK